MRMEALASGMEIFITVPAQLTILDQIVKVNNKKYAMVCLSACYLLYCTHNYKHNCRSLLYLGHEAYRSPETGLLCFTNHS